MSSILMEKNESGTGQENNANVGAHQWNGLKDWELFDNFAQKTLEKLIEKMFNKDKIKNTKTI